MNSAPSSKANPKRRVMPKSPVAARTTAAQIQTAITASSPTSTTGRPGNRAARRMQ
jgi:hypothetical protein